MKGFFCAYHARDSAVAAVERVDDETLLEQAGFQVRELTDELRRHMQLPRTMRGVLIREVEPGSPAFRSGLRNGMIIRSLNRTDVDSMETFQEALKSAGTENLLLLVHVPQHGARYMVVRLN